MLVMIVGCREVPVEADAATELDPGTDADAAPAPPFGPRSDHALRALLASSPIVAVERGRGGRSLAFRLTLADGTRAYFKPEQTFSGMHWYAEIAAHHLDRALGLGRAPVVVGRRVAWAALAGAAEGDPRVPEIVIAEDGTVRGAMVAWIEGRLVPLHAPAGWERWVSIDAPAAITPFQSARAWRRARSAAAHAGALEGGGEPSNGSVLDAGVVIVAVAPEPDTLARPAELSDLVLFDFLAHNVDRWSANSTNVRTLGPEGPLVHLDQAAGFSPRRARLTLLDERLAAIQRFRRRTVDAVRALDLDAFAETLARDPLAPILEPRQLEHLAERRQALLDHVDALVTEHGQDTVYAW